MAKEQCPVCDDYQGEGDFDPDIGKFYTCRACGHQWHYAAEAAQPSAESPTEAAAGRGA